MNNITISMFLLHHPKTMNCFIGCYPSDNIPTSDIYPYSAVINTDKTGYPGKHWVAIYVQNKNTIEYFDSFGEVPNANISKYLMNFENISMNKSKIQSLFSDVCGQYCIYFLLKRCMNVPYKIILGKLLFIKNSDSYVKNFVYALTKV